MGLGYLKVETHTADDALPVSGAKVAVKDNGGRTLYQLTTDLSGNTNEVELYAPDKPHTLNPNDPGPYYATYTVEISRPGYETKIIKGVQIFDTIPAILPVIMLPLPESLSRTGDVDVIDIPPSGLLIQENSQQIEPFMNSRLVKEVIIPDYITVHLGHPSASARNIRVKFSDYIKNVASSEIYPTWPVASLEANIYAIISFALNRVFTEWYRSRGYPFDITNSTQ